MSESERKSKREIEMMDREREKNKLENSSAIQKTSDETNLSFYYKSYIFHVWCENDKFHL